MTYTPPPFPAGLAPGHAQPSARELQKALKTAGYMSSGIAYADIYGPATQAAVRAFHAANPAYGTAGDGAIGPQGWAALHRQAFGGAAKPAGEPAGDYRHLIYGGHTVNERTRILLERARAKLGIGHELRLLQGSYNRGGVSASAGTHDGGGVIDVDPTQASDHNTLLKALREAGFAAWYRVPAEGPWTYHIHAVAIGDAQLAPVARQQVTAYFNGRNGLAGNGRDTAPAWVGRPWPAWANKYR